MMKRDVVVLEFIGGTGVIRGLLHFGERSRMSGGKWTPERGSGKGSSEGEFYY